MAAKRFKGGTTDIARTYQNPEAVEMISLNDIDPGQRMIGGDGDKKMFTPKDGHVQSRDRHTARQHGDIQALVNNGLKVVFGPTLDHLDQNAGMGAVKAVDQTVKALA